MSMLTDRRLSSWLSGAVHAQNSGDDHGLQEKPPALTIIDSTVAAVETFKFLGSIISQDLKLGHSHRLHCKKGPTKVVLPSPAEEV